jgi:hypothetical protein
VKHDGKYQLVEVEDGDEGGEGGDVSSSISSSS